MTFARLFIFVMLSLPALPAQAAEPIVRASLISEYQQIEAGKPFRVGVLLEPQKEGWHTYYKDPGDAGLATTLNWHLSEDYKVSEIDWPPFKKLDEAGIVVNAYIGSVLLPVTITPPSGSHPDDAHYTLSVHAQWLVCHEICIPESADLVLTLPIIDGTPQKSEQAQLFTEGTKDVPVPPKMAPKRVTKAVDFPLTLLFALLGGLILNLMPCVLPVLSLKALTLVKKAGSEKAAARRQGIAYTFGVLLSFALVASVLIGLQKAGQAVGWGYQMQSPAFVSFLIFLLFTVGLNLSGIFELPVLLGRLHVSSHASARGSFLTGVLATAVATPCTAPFMASAVGVALTLPPLKAMLVFEALGLGLALPFLLISFCPPLLRLLPKPGHWMYVFRHVLAFAMYGSVIWLLWVLTLQIGAGGMAVALTCLLLLTAALMIRHKPWLALLLAAIVWVGGLSSLSGMPQQQHNMMPPSTEMQGVEVVSFSKDKLAELRMQHKTVFVDATAAWCITCQVNARTAIRTPRAVERFRRRGAVLMIADWTQRNAEITEFLADFGYNGVPLYVVYPADGEPKVLPQILTTDIVVDAIP